MKIIPLEYNDDNHGLKPWNRFGLSSEEKVTFDFPFDLHLIAALGKVKLAEELQSSFKLAAAIPVRIGTGEGERDENWHTGYGIQTTLKKGRRIFSGNLCVWVYWSLPNHLDPDISRTYYAEMLSSVSLEGIYRAFQRAAEPYGGKEGFEDVIDDELARYLNDVCFQKGLSDKLAELEHEAIKWYERFQRATGRITLLRQLNTK